jgi:hypothetical protein
MTRKLSERTDEDIVAEEMKIYNQCGNICDKLKSLKFVASTSERATGVKFI